MSKIEFLNVDLDVESHPPGKYAKRSAEGTNLVALEPDVAKEFPDSQSVNEALRSLLKSGKHRRGA